MSLPKEPSKSFIALNPHLYAKRPAAVAAPAKGKEESPLEAKFMAIWALANPEDDLRPEREFRFFQPRRWRLDFAWPQVRVGVEVEGGIHQGGRHNRAAGFIADCEKYNRAALEGWTIFRLPTGGVTEEAVGQILSFLRRR